MLIFTSIDSEYLQDNFKFRILKSLARYIIHGPFKHVIYTFWDNILNYKSREIFACNLPFHIMSLSDFHIGVILTLLTKDLSFSLLCKGLGSFNLMYFFYRHSNCFLQFLFITFFHSNILVISIQLLEKDKVIIIINSRFHF